MDRYRVLTPDAPPSKLKSALALRSVAIEPESTWFALMLAIVFGPV